MTKTALGFEETRAVGTDTSHRTTGILAGICATTYMSEDYARLAFFVLKFLSLAAANSTQQRHLPPSLSIDTKFVTDFDHPMSPQHKRPL
jgi:hypothetical protein